jgi:hypothetical protein
MWDAIEKKKIQNKTKQLTIKIIRIKLKARIDSKD